MPLSSRGLSHPCSFIAGTISGVMGPGLAGTWGSAMSLAGGDTAWWPQWLEGWATHVPWVGATSQWVVDEADMGSRRSWVNFSSLGYGRNIWGHQDHVEPWWICPAWGQEEMVPGDDHGWRVGQPHVPWVGATWQWVVDEAGVGSRRS